jgi:plasmid replication initiation protein
MKKTNKQKKGLALIKKANNLIEARYKFDIWETRLFLSVLAQIHKDDADFKTYRIQYKDVIKTFDLTSRQSYDLLREGAQSLMKKPLFANYEINGQYREKQYHIIRSIDYLDGNMQQTEDAKKNGEYIDVTIDPDMKPLLLQLREQGGFTFYEMNNVVKLGVYPLRIYELLKQYQRFGKRTFEIEELKVMFELTNEYPLFANFYQRVIEPAVKEINEHTDLFITNIEKIKKGKKVTALAFQYHIKPKEKSAITPPDLFSQMTIVEEEIETYETLETQTQTQAESDRLFRLFQEVVVGDFGVSPTVFITALGTHNEEQINQAIRVTLGAIKEGKAKNSAAFFVDALRKGFTNPQEEKSKKKTAQAAKIAHNEQILKKINDIEEIKNQAMNDKIRALTTVNPEITEEAIAILHQKETYQKIIARKEKEVGRTLCIDDFREDVVLRNGVKMEIMQRFEGEFEVITASYEKQIVALKQQIVG